MPTTLAPEQKEPSNDLKVVMVRHRSTMERGTRDKYGLLNGRGLIGIITCGWRSRGRRRSGRGAGRRGRGPRSPAPSARPRPRPSTADRSSRTGLASPAATSSPQSPPPPPGLTDSLTLTGRWKKGHLLLGAATKGRGEGVDEGEVGRGGGKAWWTLVAGGGGRCGG